MKALNIFLVAFLSLFILGCNDDKKIEQKLEFKTISSFADIKEDKMTFLFLSKPGCKWCAKQKEDFKAFDYINRFPQYDFIKVESNEPIFRQLYTSAFPVSSFPTLVVMQRSGTQFIVVENLEGYANKEILEPILEFNKDLVGK
ncbi:MAG: hypothetical protein ABF301_02230 [Sulfurovum sp.]|jgi:thioredoxin-related protein